MVDHNVCLQKIYYSDVKNDSCMFEFSLLSAAKEERPASSCPSAIFGKIGKNSPNLAGMILHNSVDLLGITKLGNPSGDGPKGSHFC